MFFNKTTITQGMNEILIAFANTAQTVQAHSVIYFLLSVYLVFGESVTEGYNMQPLE